MLAVLLLLQLVFAYDVYIVPHSHCDLGWLDTIDGYYNSHVGKILDNIVTILQKDTKRKIVWSETSYLKQWIEKSGSKREIFKRLLSNGQIEIVGGGFVQNDEANPDFDMVIRQINMGHEYLKQEFNITKVQVAWQIDPFGFSALTPSIFAKFGYEYLVTNRIDVNFKEQLFKEKNIEFIWEGVNFGDNESILLHNLYDHYIFPDFFHHDNSRHCFPSGDLTEKVISDCTDLLYGLIEKRRKAHRHDNLMLLYGDDFYYVREFDAELKYKRIEAIRDYIGKKYPNINIKIATASEYFEAIKAQKIEFSVYKADLLPYVNHRSSGELGIWTGYYTTRPHLKQKIFETNQLARAAEIVQALSLKANFYAPESSLTLHHDAITGTCRPHVSDDYKARLAFERKNEIRAIKDAIKGKFTEVNDTFSLALPYRVVIVYNPLNWEKVNLLSFEVDNGKFIQIKDWTGKIVVSQSVKNLLDDKKTVYIKLKLPALSFVTLFINDYTEKCVFCDSESEQSISKTVSDKYFTINLDDFGMVNSIIKSSVTYDLSQTFWTYSGKKAGAYLFHPPDSGNKIKDLKLEKIVVSKGEVLETVEVIWKRSEKVLKYDHYYQKIILYGEPRFIWKYGLYATSNDEILVRFSSGDISGDKWLLTSNSGDLRERKYYQESSSQKGYNMYPIPGGFAVKMKQDYLKVFPKFSVGVALVDNSSFELLLHRKLQQDDGFGLGMGVQDDTFVHYHFEVEMGELTHRSYMKSYLEAKTDVYTFTLKSPNEILITDDIWSEGTVFDYNWNKERVYSLGFNSSDYYLSSAGMKNDKLFMRVLNLKDSSQSLHVSGWEFSHKSLFNGNLNYTTYPYPYRANTEISFLNRGDTGMKKLLPRADEESNGEIMMKPYEFAAYYVEVVTGGKELESSTENESDKEKELKNGTESESEDSHQMNGNITEAWNKTEEKNSTENSAGENETEESENQTENKNDTLENKEEEEFANNTEENNEDFENRTESLNSNDENEPGDKDKNKTSEENNEESKNDEREGDIKEIKTNEETNISGNETHYIIVNISDADEEKLDGSQIIEFCILFGLSVVFIVSIVIYIRRKRHRIRVI